MKAQDSEEKAFGLVIEESKEENKEVSSSDSEGEESDENEHEFNMLRQHAQKVESDINKCLVCRISEENKFAKLNALDKELIKLSN